jgi:hypothetical protein
MDETEQFSKLVGHIYDAALDPDQWMDVLQRAATFLGSATATLRRISATAGGRCGPLSCG